MDPAPSVIIFTVFSGLGFGLLTWIGLGLITPTGWGAFGYFALAFGLAVVGLLASTFHLGNPKNALLAFTQWRSSWLSREAWLSLAALASLGLYAIGGVFFNYHIRVLGVLGGALSLATVYATSMIYAQLRTIPRWNHWTTVALFVLFSLAGGALLAAQPRLAAFLLLILGAVQIFAWASGDTRFSERGSTLQTATGLGKNAQIRLLESPHSGTNYLLREMVHVVGRKHAIKLRVIALLSACIIPAVLLLAVPNSNLLTLIAALFHLIGAFAARWLFFAQAEHVVGLYYGKHT